MDHGARAGVLQRIVYGRQCGANESPQQQDTRRFTYSWQFRSDSELAPRGGTTRVLG